VERPAPKTTRTQMAADAPGSVMLLHEIETADDKRFLTGLGEFDRVMGNGIVPGSVTLIGGDPGSANPPSFCKPAVPWPKAV